MAAPVLDRAGCTSVHGLGVHQFGFAVVIATLQRRRMSQTPDADIGAGGRHICTAYRENRTASGVTLRVRSFAAHGRCPGNILLKDAHAENQLHHGLANRCRQPR